MKIFNFENRKIIVCSLYRKLLKSSQKLKQIDEYVYDYTKILIRKDFDLCKKEMRSSVLNKKIKYGEAILNDLENLDYSDFNFIVRKHL